MPATTALVITVGEILVEFVSLNTGCGLARRGTFAGPFPSGAPAIFLDQAARVGARATMVGAVGDDGFGRLTLERLAADGVDVSAVRRDPDKATGVAFVSYFEDGSRTFIFHVTGTAADAFDASAVEAAVADGPVILHVSGSSLGNSAIRAAVLAAVSRAVRDGWRISFDPNVRPELFHEAAVREASDAILGAAEIVLPSLEDLDFILPGYEPDAAVDELLARGASVVGLKRGANGCLVANAERRMELPGHPVEEIDPTGAGDCFCGVLVGLLAGGHDLEEAARFANAAGALSVTHRGPMEGARPLAEIRRFLETGEVAG